MSSGEASLLVSVKFRRLKDAERIAELLGAFLPDASRRTVGVLELLLNAVEHGNLGLSAEDKEQLMRDGKWHPEVARRSESAPWSSRQVSVSLEQLSASWRMIVQDEGEGFVPDSIRPSAVTARRGRGLQLVRSAFDEVQWVGRGNCVIAVVNR